jgi:hypothetical protein
MHRRARQDVRPTTSTLRSTRYPGLWRPLCSGVRPGLISFLPWVVTRCRGSFNGAFCLLMLWRLARHVFGPDSVLLGIARELWYDRRLRFLDISCFCSPSLICQPSVMFQGRLSLYIRSLLLQAWGIITSLTEPLVPLGGDLYIGVGYSTVRSHHTTPSVVIKSISKLPVCVSHEILTWTSVSDRKAVDISSTYQQGTSSAMEDVASSSEPRDQLSLPSLPT